MNRRKSIALAILIVLLLTFAVNGTIAYITTKTGSVENVFTPAEVKTDIDEPGWGDGNTVKTAVVVKNTGNVDVWVRVAVVGNWVNEDGKIVDSWTPNFNVSTDWIKAEDGYYYYNSKLSSVEPDNTTADLLDSDISGVDPNRPGQKLVVTVIHQSIQADGMGATTALEAFAMAQNSITSD